MNNKDNRTAIPYYTKDSVSELVLIKKDNPDKNLESVEEYSTDYNEVFVLTEKGRRLGKKN